MPILWDIGRYIAGQLSVLLFVLVYEKTTRKPAEDVRSLRPMPTWKFTAIYGLGLGLLSCLLNRPLDSRGGVDVNHVLSAFLTYGIGIPLYGTLGALVFRPLGLAGIGQITGGLGAALGETRRIAALVLSQFGYHYCVWWV